MTTPPPSSLPTDEMIDKAWGDFINCRDDQYFGNRGKLDKQKDVLRKFAAQVLAIKSPEPGVVMALAAARMALIPNVSEEVKQDAIERINAAIKALGEG